MFVLPLHEAVRLGSLLEASPAARDINRCAIGMALRVHSLPVEYEEMWRAYPALREMHAECPWCCAEMSDQSIVYHPFDSHVIDRSITIDEFCDWLRSLPNLGGRIMLMDDGTDAEIGPSTKMSLDEALGIAQRYALNATELARLAVQTALRANDCYPSERKDDPNEILERLYPGEENIRARLAALTEATLPGRPARLDSSEPADYDRVYEVQKFDRKCRAYHL